MKDLDAPILVLPPDHEPVQHESELAPLVPGTSDTWERMPFQDGIKVRPSMHWTDDEAAYKDYRIYIPAELENVCSRISSMANVDDMFTFLRKTMAMSFMDIYHVLSSRHLCALPLLADTFELIKESGSAFIPLQTIEELTFKRKSHRNSEITAEGTLKEAVKIK